MTKDEKVESYCRLVEDSITKALIKQSHADDFALNIGGMSTNNFRCFLNNLCAEKGASYLEIGTYKGGTICSAISNNPDLTSYAIDDFSEFNQNLNVEAELNSNINRFRDTTKSVTFIKGDSFTLDKNLITSKIDFYLYDGGHSKEDHIKALTDYFDKMNDVFVFIVDDYNWGDVSSGTQEAIQLLKDKCKVEKEWTFLTPANFSPVWHNGCYMAVISKL